MEEFLIGAFGAVLMFGPWLLAGIAWTKWSKAGRPRDVAFLTGTSLTTISCCEAIPFVIPYTTRWEQMRVDVMSYGALISAVFSIIGIIVLPFAGVRGKWLAFGSSLLNFLFVAMFLVGLAV